MKTELIDIQSALSKCRSSLHNIHEFQQTNNDNSTVSTFLMNTPTSIKTSSPYLVKFKKLNSHKKQHRSSSNSKNSMISCSTPKKKSSTDNITWSSSLNEVETENHNLSHSLSSSLLTTDDESSAGYPSRSICQHNKNQLKHKKFPFLNNNNNKLRSGSSSIKRNLFANNQSTPTFSWRSRFLPKKTSNYLYPTTIALNKIKSLRSPVRVYKHNSQRLSNMNRVKLQKIENKRNNMLEITTRKALNRPFCGDISDLFICEEKTTEISQLKCRPVSPIPSTSSSSSSISTESSISIENNINESSSPKTPFIVINHKNGYEIANNTTIFEPNLASTPILREQKTSTPNLVNTSYMDKILTDLVDNNHQIQQCFNYKLFINDNGRRLSFNENYENEKQFHYDLEDENDNYDIPEPHVFGDSDNYKIPNFSHETINEESTRHLLLHRTSTLNNSYWNSQLNLNEYDSNNNLIINKVNYNYTNVSTNNHNNMKTCSKSNNPIYNNLNDLSRTRASTNSRKYLNPNKQNNLNQFQHQQEQSRQAIKKNVTLISNASSVTSSVIKCCIRPLKNLIFNKKSLKKRR
jgi:hypothetical protein